MKKTFTGKTRLFLCIAAAIVFVALVMQLFGVGLNLGIDFTGGSLLNYSVGESFDSGDVEKILLSAGYEGSQITKAAPSDASVALQAELAAQAAQAAEEAAEAAEETAEEAVEAAEEIAEEAVEATEETVEETASETFEAILDPDKSGIEDDGLTDLQLRLNLVDETAGLEEAIDKAVTSALPNAAKLAYTELTNSVVVNTGIEGAYAGGFMATYELGEEFDSAAALEAVQAALTEGEYSVELIDAVRFDAQAEAEAAEEKAADETAEEAVEEEAAEEAPVEEAAVEEAEENEEEAVEESGTALRVLVKLDDQTTQVRALLEQQMTAKYPNFRFVSIDHVSAIAGRDLLSNAVKALLIAFACMLIYIAIRFDVFSGLAALFGLMHDVLIMCSVMVFFRGLYQVNSSFIAAVLTIVGYSINNTIIVFDRIRELRRLPGYSQKSYADIVEDSVSHTLARTINTSLTTLITLVALYAFGVTSIREFAFPLIVGMLAGTYSSVLLSGQVWAMWMEKRAAKKASGKKA